MKILSMAAEMIHADGQTDRQTDRQTWLSCPARQNPQRTF